MKRQYTATQIIVAGFLLIIVCGGILLTLPISSRQRVVTPPVDAFFTSVSATCVTGLVTLDTLNHWSGFGKAVILSLIQIGGIGFMSIAVLFSLIVRRQITPRERLVFARSMNLVALDGLVKFVKLILVGTFSIELVGAVLLSFRFIPQFGLVDGIIKSVFHAVSAFCNAGFDLMGNFQSLTAYRDDILVNFVICSLVIIGGLGFIVWKDLYEWVRYRHKISLYSRLVLIITAILLVSGTILILFSDYHNKALFGDASFGQKLQASFFQSTVTRTAGFNTIDLPQMSDNSKIVSILLMLIGGSSGSTAGGIKTVTFGLVCIAMFQIAKGKNNIIIFKRKICMQNILRAMAIAAITLSLVILCTFLISGIDGIDFLDVFYETSSAVATVGQSLGITTLLSPVSKMILMVLMFFGRVGIITVTYAILLKLSFEDNLIDYPTADVLIG